MYSTLCTLLLVTNVFGHPATPNDEVASDQETPISLEELYNSLREHSQDMVGAELGLMLMAENDGDEFYDLRDTLSRECRRTVGSFVKIKQNLATLEESDRILDDAISKTIETIKTTKELKHPVELLCDQVETAFKGHPKLATVHAEVKKSVVDASSPTIRRKRYFSSVFKSDFDFAIAYFKFVDIPGFTLAAMLGEFANQLNASQAYNGTYNVLARAIVDVAQKEEFTDKVERIREKVFTEVAAIIQKSSNILADILDTNTLGFTVPMMEKFEKYFDQDPFLRRELNLARKRIESKN